MVGLPVGAFAGEVLDALKRAEKNGESWVAYSNCHSLLSDDGMWVENMPESTTTVSYTHLDVYKRQMEGTGAGHGRRTEKYILHRRE